MCVGGEGCMLMWVGGWGGVIERGVLGVVVLVGGGGGGGVNAAVNVVYR